MGARLDAKYERTLRALLKLPDNRRCADCDTLVRELELDGPLLCDYVLRARFLLSSAFLWTVSFSSPFFLMEGEAESFLEIVA